MSNAPQPTGNGPGHRSSAAAGVLVLVGVMWLVEALDWLLPWELDYGGIWPRTLQGLDGVLWAPFLHGGFSHLMANSGPLLALGLLVAWRAGAATWKIVLVVIVAGGLGVWLLAPTNVVTIGASGLVFGLLAYLLAAGVISRRPLDVVVAIGVLAVYGGTLSGATPFGVPAGVSWLAHLSGFAAGLLAAAWFAPRRPAVAGAAA